MIILLWLFAPVLLLPLAVAAELVARWWLRHRAAYYVFPPGLRLQVRPDQEVSPHLERLVRFDVNSDGERGDEPPRSSDGLYRILVAGGSVPEGYLLDQNTSWPGALHRLLERPENLQRLGALRVHVGNIARSGAGSQMVDCVLERVLPRYRRLQVIMIFVGISDVSQWLEFGAPACPPPPARTSEVFKCHPEGPFGWKPRNLAVTQLLSRLRTRWLRPVQVEERAGGWMRKARAMRAAAKEIRTAMPDATPMLDHFERHMRQLLQNAKRHADRVLVVRQPWLNEDYTPEEAARMWHAGVGTPWRQEINSYYSLSVFSRLMALVDARAAAVAKALDVEQLDLMPILDRSLNTYYDCFHITPAGARAVAAAVAAAILRQPLQSVTVSNPLTGASRRRRGRCAYGPARQPSIQGGIGDQPTYGIVPFQSKRLRMTKQGSCAALLVSALACLVGAQPAGAQSDLWSTNGPEGGHISALAIDPQTPTTVYAGANPGGVYKSIDGGRKWSAVNTGLSAVDVRALAIDPQVPATIYAGGTGVFKSTDGGGGWTSVSVGIPSNVAIFTLAIDPQTPATVYAGSSGHGIFKSTDGGGTWNSVITGLPPNVTVLALTIDPAVPATLYAGSSGHGVFKSTDGGATWSAVNSGLTNAFVSALAIDPQVPTTLYAGGGGVFKSIDGGSSWSAVNTGLTSLGLTTLAIDPQISATLYAGTRGGGIFKSVDGGGSWSAVNLGLTNPFLNTLAINPEAPATLYAGTGGSGVFMSTEGGEDDGWKAANTGLTATFVHALAVNSQTPTAVYAGTRGGGIFKSSDGGDNWAAANAGLSTLDVTELIIDPVSATTLYAGTPAWVFKSTDEGATWRAVNNPRPINRHVLALAIDPYTPTTLYVGCNGDSLFKSTDGGSSWSAVGPISTQALAIDPQMPAILYAGTDTRLFKSTDGGTSWSTTGLTSVRVFALAVAPETPSTVYAGAQGVPGTGIFKSTDGGASWSLVTNLFVSALAVDPRAPATIYAGTTGGVFKSTDGGGSWSAINDGLASPNVRALAFGGLAPTTVYAGTEGGGVFRRTELRRFTVTVSKTGLGNGDLTSSPPGIDCGSDCSEPYVSGTTVTLTATAAFGSVFTGWSGCDAVSDSTCTVMMDADRSVTASFLGIPLILNTVRLR